MNRPEWKLLGELYRAHEDGIAFLKIKSKRILSLECQGYAYRVSDGWVITDHGIIAYCISAVRFE